MEFNFRKDRNSGNFHSNFFWNFEDGVNMSDETIDQWLKELYDKVYTNKASASISSGNTIVLGRYIDNSDYNEDDEVELIVAQKYGKYTFPVKTKKEKE